MTGEKKFEPFASIGQGATPVQDFRTERGGGPEARRPNQPPSDSSASKTGDNASGGEIALAPDIALPRIEHLPDFEPAAADCFNRALHVALSLGHANFSSDHLMLALTMDPHARKLLQRVGDIAQLREAAMIRLGKMHWKFARRAEDVNRFPSPTSDLDELCKVARHAASDREQRVAINDLVNAFPTRNGRLVYGLKETTDSVPAILERIESKLVPRVSDFLSKFETQLRESVARQLNSALQAFGEKQLKDLVERQLHAMVQNFEQRQLKELAVRQQETLAGIGKEFKDRHLAALDEMTKSLEARQLGALEEMGRQVQHDLDTLAIVLQHFRDRLSRQESGAASSEPRPTPPEQEAGIGPAPRRE